MARKAKARSVVAKNPATNRKTDPKTRPRVKPKAKLETKSKAKPNTKPKIRLKAAKQTSITPELVAAHGLKPDEYERIRKLIGRTPTFTELGIFSAMWNEHCSYKSSKIHLRTPPTKAP